jgi:8-oxo-dGTP pyrophosphatase MutT (NUDIX family)
MENLHHIQRFILDVLMGQQYARFRDMRPPKVDSNAYSYHLGVLVKQKIVTKTAKGYTLTPQGLAYIDRLSTVDSRPRQQPKIMTIVALTNEKNEVLVYQKQTQPFINYITLPSGKIHLEETIGDAADREVHEKVGLHVSHLRRAGDLYLTMTSQGAPFIKTLFHVYTKQIVSGVTIGNRDAFWQPIDAMRDAAPATRRVLQLVANHSDDEVFFDEYEEAFPVLHEL